MKYLVKEYTYFVDPHGSPDSGGKEITIESGDKWDKIYEEWLVHQDDYYQGPGEWITEDELQGSEDGYNSTYISYDMKIIPDDELEKYEKIIGDYNNL